MHIDEGSCIKCARGARVLPRMTSDTDVAGKWLI